MIVISVLGLDQFVVGTYSRKNTENLASLFECDEEEIVFYSPNSMIFHKGVEQTSWQTEIIVRAPKKYAVLESKVVDYLIKTFTDFTINLSVTFSYFEEEHHYEHVNESYPRYIERSNLAEEAMPYDDEEEYGDEANPLDRADLDIDDEEQIYLGDVFAGHEEELEALDAKKDEDCCHDGECCCHHHGHKHQH
jgi:hypothetical protein